MLFINVPYLEKDEAKQLGAKWNPTKKMWYIENKYNYLNFSKWIQPQGELVIIKNLYLIEGIRTCFKCKHSTRVICFAYDQHLNLDDFYKEDYTIHEINEKIKYETNNQDLILTLHINPIPEHVEDFIKSQQYNFKLRSSRTTGLKNRSNCCEQCDVLQGDFYLLEVDSPFYIEEPNDVSKLKIYKFQLKEDIIVSSEGGWYSTTDYMFKQYGKIKNIY